jgi:hypothetical protein
MLELRKFEIGDYFEIERRKFDMLTFLNFPDPREVAKRLATGPAYTLVNSKNIVAAGGVVPFWKGVGEGWVISSDLVPQHGIAFAKTVLRMLEDIEKNFERIQTTVDAEHKVSLKWVEWMGFKCEGLMRKFIGGRDYYRFARVRS